MDALAFFLQNFWPFSFCFHFVGAVVAFRDNLFIFQCLIRVFRVGDLHLRRTMVGMGWRFRLVVIAQTVLHLDEVTLKKKKQFSILTR